jgi:hypothetical protein
MSDFERWSRWFACGRELGGNKTHAVALMAWIAAHAHPDGTGLEFDVHSWSSLSDEIGLTAEEGRQALDNLISHGLVTAIGQETPDHLLARAVV